MSMLGQDSGWGVLDRVPPGIRSWAGRHRHLLPASRDALELPMVWTFITHLSIVRSLVLSARFRGWFLVERGTRIKIGTGSRVAISPGSFFLVGFVHYGATPTSIHLGRRATLSIDGTVLIRKGARLFVHDDACLEFRSGSGVADHTTVTCFDHILFEEGSGTSWCCNVLDTNGHVFVINGDPKPVSAPIHFAPEALVGSYCTVLPGVTIGEGAVVAAGSVVTKDVPPHCLAGGNPARVLSEDVTWSD